MKKIIISTVSAVLILLILFTVIIFTNPVNVTTVKLYMISKQSFIQKETFEEYKQSLDTVVEFIEGYRDKVPENGRIYFGIESSVLKNKYISLRSDEESIKITLTDAQHQAFTDVSDLFYDFGGYVETIYFYSDGTIWFSNFKYREDIVYSPNKRPSKFHSENVTGVPVVHKMDSDWYTISLSGSFWDLIKALVSNTFK
ncbi:MAG: DUF4179 domain-containing protein [Clostridia bacterium]|nr:DUF4179 domain-containing protein [Clostridia bacterium]